MRNKRDDANFSRLMLITLHADHAPNMELFRHACIPDYENVLHMDFARIALDLINGSVKQVRIGDH